MKSRWMVCAVVAIAALLLATPPVMAQTEIIINAPEESAADSGLPVEEESASTADTEPTATGDSELDTAPTEPEQPPEQKLPGEVSVKYVESEHPEPKKSGVYSKQVQGKLWLEGFAGPTLFNPDRFGIRYDDDFGGGHIGGELGIPTVKGPEFGGTIGGAFIDQAMFIGGTYRQANYREPTGGSYKLMKIGVDLQLTAVKVSYVHPLVRLAGGYARYFAGDFSTVGLKTNGFYFSMGAGVRIPILKWVSIFGIFDWSFVSVTPKGREGPNDLNAFISGSQLGGTFGLTLHFVGIDRSG